MSDKLKLKNKDIYFKSDMSIVIFQEWHVKSDLSIVICQKSCSLFQDWFMDVSGVILGC